MAQAPTERLVSVFAVVVGRVGRVGRVGLVLSSLSNSVLMVVGGGAAAGDGGGGCGGLVGVCVGREVLGCVGEVGLGGEEEEGGAVCGASRHCLSSFYFAFDVRFFFSVRKARLLLQRLRLLPLRRGCNSGEKEGGKVVMGDLHWHHRVLRAGWNIFTVLTVHVFCL